MPSKRSSAEAQTMAPFVDPGVTKELVSLVQSSPGTGVWLWEIHSGTVHWSPEVYRIFDAPRFNNTLKKFQDMVVPEDREAGLQIMSRALETRQIFQTHFRAITPKGKLCHVSNVGRAVYDQSGKPTKVVGLVAKLSDSVGEIENPPKRERKRHAWAIREIAKIHELLSVAKNRPLPSAANRDLMVIRLLLSHVMDPQPAQKLAEKLLQEFKGLAEVLSARRSRLKAIAGVREEHMQLFQIAKLSMEGVLLPKNEPIRFGNKSSLLNYVRVSHAYQDIEQFRIIFMDRADHVIASEIMQEGTIDHTPVYVREVIKRALELSASSIVLVHNHPSGDPTPSRIDIEMTKKISNAGEPLGITVKDHIILGRYGHLSLASLGLI